jgi:hydroxymethylbilane synthase
MNTASHIKSITVASRKSPLAIAQVDEVLEQLAQHIEGVEFISVATDTHGDKDLKTSLRTLGKTDFFTKAVDNLVLDSVCQVAVHSAKDLPDPLPRRLRIVALTKGLDPSDSLVLRKGMTLDTLPKGAVIATSSERREQTVKALRRDLSFVDIRGTIGDRLAKLENGEVDGVVVAEAALIRLKLTHLNRMRLPGDTTPCQGQLAVVARDDDQEMAAFFALIDSRVR